MKKKNDGTPSINGNAKRFLLQRTRRRLDEIGQRLQDVSNDVRTALGEDSDLFSWVESLRGDTLDTIDIVDHEIGNSSTVNEGSSYLSDGESGWFNERGELMKPLPGQCIEDCSGSGRVDDQVAYWVDKLGFDIDMPRDKAIEFLSEYGAWESDEIEDMDIIELAEKVLWIFCGNIKEEAYEQSRDETSLVYDWGDVSDWDDEDWKKFQEEYSYCSLNS